MKEKRGYSAAAHHEKKGFLITGGYRNGPMSSTEITKDGVTFEYFTPLPIGVINHCAVALNDEEDGDFFVGSGSIPGSPGIPSSYSKRAFIHKGGKWNEMTQMVHARSGKKPSLEMRMIWYIWSTSLQASSVALSGQAQGEGWKRLWLQVGVVQTKWRSTTSPQTHGREVGDQE